MNKSNINKNWVIGILFGTIVLVTAALITSICYDSSIVKNYLSIASQLASIVLAIVAIIYAFSQSNRSDNQYNMMDKKLNDISNEVVRLQNIKINTQTLTNRVYDIVEKTKESLPDKGNEKTKQSLNDISQEMRILKNEARFKIDGGKQLSFVDLLSELDSEKRKTFNRLGEAASELVEANNELSKK